MKSYIAFYTLFLTILKKGSFTKKTALFFGFCINKNVTQVTNSSGNLLYKLKTNQYIMASTQNPKNNT